MAKEIKGTFKNGWGQAERSGGSNVGAVPFSPWHAFCSCSVPRALSFVVFFKPNHTWRSKSSFLLRCPAHGGCQAERCGGSNLWAVLFFCSEMNQSLPKQYSLKSQDFLSLHEMKNFISCKEIKSRSQRTKSSKLTGVSTIRHWSNPNTSVFACSILTKDIKHMENIDY